MKNSDDKLKLLQRHIQCTESVANGKGRVPRVLGTIKLAFKEGDIKDFE